MSGGILDRAPLHLKTETVLMYYDGDQLWSARDEAGNAWIVVHTDDAQNYDTYLAARIEDDVLRAVLECEKPLRAAFTTAAEVHHCVVTWDGANTEVSATRLTHPIEDALLPMRGVTLR